MSINNQLKELNERIDNLNKLLLENNISNNKRMEIMIRIKDLQNTIFTSTK